jgi:hypothetical protein
MNLPFYYDYKNARNSTINPSTVHVRDTGLQRYFARYLLQKTISVFKWDMPKTWSRNYLLYTLYCWGYVAVINTDKFGVIPQQCTLGGFDVIDVSETPDEIYHEITSETAETDKL